MTEERMLDKSKVVCPLSLKLGVVQNYRVTERPNKGCYESRPVKGTDKWADDFFKILHGEKGQQVTLSDGSAAIGLGQPDAQALKFTHEMGAQARKLAVQRVNNGLIRAPKKNWDANFGPEGGLPLDELKQKYPGMYGTTTRRANEPDEEVIDDDALAALDLDEEMDAADRSEMQQRSREHTEGSPGPGVVAEGLDDDDLQAVAEELEDDAASYNEKEESFAVEAMTEPGTVEDDALEDLLEDSTHPGESASQASAEGRLSGAAAARHQQKETTGSGHIPEFDEPMHGGTNKGQAEATEMTIQAPEGGATVVRGAAMRCMENNHEVTRYKIRHPETNEVIWAKEGWNESMRFTLKVRR